jgi:hypothetical protein
MHAVNQCFQSWSSRAIRKALVRLNLPPLRISLSLSWQTWRRVHAVERCLHDAAELHAYFRTYAEHGHASACTRAFFVWRDKVDLDARLRKSQSAGLRCWYWLALGRWRGLIHDQAHARLQRVNANSHACRRWVSRWVEETNFQARRQRSQRLRLALSCGLALRRLRAADAHQADRLFERYVQSVICRRIAISRWRDESAARVRLRYNLRLQRLVLAWGQRRLAAGLARWAHHLRQRYTQRPLPCAPEALRAFLWRQVFASTSWGLVRLFLRSRERRAAVWRAHLGAMHHDQAKCDCAFNRWRYAIKPPPDRH